MNAAAPAENGSRRRGLVLLLTVFVLGLICGAALTLIGAWSVSPPRTARWFGARHPQQMGRGMERMIRELDLDAGQQRAVREVFERTRHQIHQTLDASTEEIRGLLDDEQRQKFDALRRQLGPRDRRHRPGAFRDRGGEPPGPPPPPPPDDGE